jgi:hypothetical protein
MNLKNYKKEAKRMFYLSVDKDIDKWKGGPESYNNYESPYYNNSSFTSYFRIYRSGAFPYLSNMLQIKNSSENNPINICRYFFLFFQSI